MLIHIRTHFPDKNSRHCLLFLEFNNDYTLQSMLVCFHVATIPFSWKFGFDKLSKYDELG